MNTIPGKVLHFLHDALFAFKNLIRKRSFVAKERKLTFKTLETDFEALDSLCYFLLGTSFDCILDTIYETDVPKAKSNPLPSLFIVILFYHIPSVLVFVEIIGAVPGKATLYTFAYVGINEMIAFVAGWTWIGAAAAREATALHYFISGILRHFPAVQDFGLIFDYIAASILILIPFVSKRLSIGINSAGVTFKVILALFLLSYTDPKYWFTPSKSDQSTMIVSTFAYLQLYFCLPMVSPVLYKATRTGILLSKTIALAICAALFHAFFFLVLTGNAPYAESMKPWVETIIGRRRPTPYLLLFVMANHVSAMSGLFALINSSTIIIEQMSSDGVIFNFFSSSENSRKIFFVLITFLMYVNDEEVCSKTFATLSSIGMLLGGFCLLFLKSTGLPGFYDRSNPRNRPIKQRSKKKRAFIEATVKSMLVFVTIGCLLGSFVGRRLFLELEYEGASFDFAILMISLCFVGIALLILTIVPKFRSVHSPIHCPLGPYLPITIMLVSSVNVALDLNQCYVPTLSWLGGGLIVYLLFGLRNVTSKLNPDLSEEAKLKHFHSCQDKELEDFKIFNILKRRYKACKDKEIERKKLLKLCKRRIVCEESIPIPLPPMD